MADEGGETIRGRRAGDVIPTGTVPTGESLASEGSSVETGEDIATAEEIPSTEEILRKGEEARRKGPLPHIYPAPPHAPAEGAREVPHDKGRMQEIE